MFFLKGGDLASMQQSKLEKPQDERPEEQFAYCGKFTKPCGDIWLFSFMIALLILTFVACACPLFFYIMRYWLR